MIGAKCDLGNRFVKKFLTLEDEHIIYATRQDWSVILPGVLLNISLLVIFALITSFVFIISPGYLFVIIILSILIFSVAMEVLIKNIVEWYFHFYIVTNRKIVEVAYRPMFSKIIYEVLIDQVRCTEIDVRGKGFFAEVFNIGTILITFDRPTHEKIFTIEQIKDPRTAAMHLADSFEMQTYSEEDNSWLSNPLTNASL